MSSRKLVGFVVVGTVHPVSVRAPCPDAAAVTDAFIVLPRVGSCHRLRDRACHAQAGSSHRCASAPLPLAWRQCRRASCRLRASDRGFGLHPRAHGRRLAALGAPTLHKLFNKRRGRPTGWPHRGGGRAERRRTSRPRALAARGAAPACRRQAVGTRACAPSQPHQSHWYAPHCVDRWHAHGDGSALGS
jgi:hypothetical protein